MDQDLKQYLDAKFAAMEQSLRVELEAMEMRLRTEFLKWGGTNNRRMQRLDSSDATTVDRMTNLESRVFDLERRRAS